MSSVLVSCSNTILTHSLDDQNPVTRFTPHEGKINWVTWNHNNRVIASAGSDGNVILSHSETCQRLAVLPSETNASINSVAFTSKSTLAASGSSDGQISIWDLRKKEMVQTFENAGQGINSVAWNQNDALLAAGGASGDIGLYSVSQEVQIGSLNSRNEQGVKQVEFSQLKSQVLASCHESGSIRIWDSNARTNQAVFPNFHSSTVSGIAFSPVNHMLLCSGGLDQRIHFFDIHNSRLVKTIDCEYPLTSMSFFADGHTLAVGTLYGTIQSYDLRAVHNNITLQGHNGNAVNCLDFINARYREITPVQQRQVQNDKPAQNRFRDIEEIRQQAKRRVEQKIQQNREEKKVQDSPKKDKKVVERKKRDLSHDPIPVNKSEEVVQKDYSLESIRQRGSVSPVLNEKPPVTTKVEVSQPKTEPVKTEPPYKPEPIQSKVELVQQVEVPSVSQEQIYRLENLIETRFSELHIEMIRQFTIQMVTSIQIDMKALLEKYATDNSALLNRIQELEDEVSRLKNTTY